MIEEIVKNWNYIPILMAAIFLYAWLLNIVLFRPILKVLDERESRSRDAASELTNSKDSLRVRLEEYENAVLEAHRKGTKIKESARKEADRERREKLDEVSSGIKADKDLKLKELSEEEEKVKTELTAQMPAFALDMAKSILGREVAS